MKKNIFRQSGFLQPRALLALGFVLTGIVITLVAFGLYPGGKALAQPTKPTSPKPEKQPGTPDVLQLVGPFSQDADLRTLPDIPQLGDGDDEPLMRYPHKAGKTPEKWDPMQIVRKVLAPATMPGPLATYPGIDSVTSACGCLPPDTQGDVGLNHYIQGVNSRFKILDKSGNQLLAATTYNTLFAPMGAATPCGNNQNRGDAFILYDHLSDRWLVSDFAFGAFPGAGPFYQCVAVSKTSDPVAGGWWLYAVQVDPANPSWLGDYPKFSLWPDAYYFTVNMFANSTTFTGVRVFALPRLALVNGTGAPNAGGVAFTLTAANIGATYSLVPATFRAGAAPPAGTDQYLLAIDSPDLGGVVQTQVHAWRFHADFATPANSTFGVGAAHTPNAEIAVNGFVDAFTDAAGFSIVPQNGTTARLQTLGDKIMTPVFYQNRAGVESLYASHTVNNNQNSTGPTAIRWYQLDVTGSTIPATPAQQQTFDNQADGLWRFMPSISVDGQGNMAIAYSTSGSTSEPSMRYAGRFGTDPANTLAQGEAVMQAGGGHQTSTSARWGDYSYLSVDPTDNATFWHTNEYYSATSSSSWNTRIGTFKFPNAPLLAASAVSRKTHTGVGDLDIALPLSGGPGIEPRNSGGNHILIFTFTNDLTSGSAAVSGGIGSVQGTPTVSGKMLTVNLTGVTDAQTLTVTLSNVTDVFAQTLPSTPVNIGFLVGDSTADGVVNGGDSIQVRGRAGQAADATTVRSDVNTDGIVNGGDSLVVRARSGNSL